MSDNSSNQGEIKYVSIARVNDGTLLLALPSTATKKAYADEVSIFINFIYYFISKIIIYRFLQDDLILF